MREAIGNAFIVNIIVIFIVVFIVIFAGSTSYTKAYKVKNQIINIIEEHHGDYVGATADINNYLGEVGYRVGGNGTCPAGSTAAVSNYRYCYAKITQNTGSERGGNYYYRITTYMYFELPIIESLIRIPVSGETKTFGILENAAP